MHAVGLRHRYAADANDRSRGIYIVSATGGGIRNKEAVPHTVGFHFTT